MKLSRHFKLEEFDLDETSDAKLIANAGRVAFELEFVRRCLDDAPIHITSGYRSPEKNEAVGGERNSLHLKALAADFYVEGWSTDKACQALHPVLPFLKFDQLIAYTGHFHLGLKPNESSYRRQFMYNI